MHVLVYICVLLSILSTNGNVCFLLVAYLFLLALLFLCWFIDFSIFCRSSSHRQTDAYNAHYVRRQRQRWRWMGFDICFMYEYVASKTFEFRIQCECSRYFAMCVVYLLLWTCYFSLSFLYFMRCFIYFICFYSLFYVPALFVWFQWQTERRSDVNTARTNHKHIHKLVVWENILLFVVFVKINIFIRHKCTKNRLSATLNSDIYHNLPPPTTYSKIAWICSRTLFEKAKLLFIIL